MKTAIIIHGMPDKDEYYSESRQDSQSNSHWLPWLQKELCRRDILAQTPEMPMPYDPNYQSWLDTVGQFQIDSETILVGHSCGAGFLLKMLSENKSLKADRLVMVAPYLGEGDNQKDFFDFQINTELSARVGSVTILYSESDESYIVSAAKLIKSKLPAVELIEIPDKGHLTLGDLGTREFPELLNVCIE